MDPDPQLRRWFDRGELEAAIVGDGSYYISAPDFAVHDRLRVFRALLQWASDDAKKDGAARAVQSSVQSMLRSGRVDDAVDILVCYVIEAEDAPDTLPLNRTTVSRMITSTRDAYSATGQWDPNRQAHLQKLESRLSSLKSRDQR